MTTEQFDLVMRLFQAASQLPAEEQGSFLDAECRDCAEVRRSVEAMLRHDRAEEKENDSLVGAGAALVESALRDKREMPDDEPLPGDAWIGRSVGRYRIVGVLGVGGMATVFEAEQDRPSRLVALKVLSTTLCSTQMLRRFEFEAEVLARLQHPHIAQIYDVGTLDDELAGHPFFAMEKVVGIPLTDFVTHHGLPAARRLELLVKVCRAVEFAHQKGIVHRDLKPANILVDEHANPKILDFGIARSTDVDVRRTTMHTAPGQLVGTLAYMSPEQFTSDGGGVDIRADVYALGVILFELLTNRLPFDVSGRPIPEVARLIVENDPPSLGTIDRSLRGDPDTIVAKALEKDPARRYATAAALAADVERFLQNEPILARPTSAMYQLRKLVQRHKTPFVLAALLFVAVTVLAVVSTIQAGRVANERDRALLAEQRATDRSQQIQNLAHSFIFDLHDVIRDLPGSTKARELIATTAIEYLDQIRADSTTNSSVLLDIAAGYIKVAQSQGALSVASRGQPSLALDSLQKAVAILEPLADRESLQDGVYPALSSAYESMGEALQQQGKADLAAQAYAKGLAAAETHLARNPQNRAGRRSVMVQSNNMAEMHARQGRLDEALAIYRKSAATAQALSTGDPMDVRAKKDVAYTLTRIAKILAAKGLDSESLAHAEKAFQILTLLAAAHPTNADVQRMLAVACVDLGDHLHDKGEDSSALDQYLRADRMYERLLAVDSKNARARMDLANSAERIGGIFQLRGEFDPAAVRFRRSLELRAENARSAPDNSLYRRELAVAHEKMGNVALDRHAYGDALASYNRSSEIRTELADMDPNGRQAQRDLSVSYYKIGAAYAVRGAIEDRVRTDRLSDWRMARTFFERALAHMRWMEKNGLVSPSDADVPAFLNSQVERAESALKALRADDAAGMPAAPAP